LFLLQAGEYPPLHPVLRFKTKEEKNSYVVYALFKGSYHARQA